MNILDFRLSIVGPGRAARALARTWVESGGRLEEVVARDLERAARAVEEIGSGRPRAADTSPFACDVLVLGMPDDAIRGVAQALAGQVSCRFAFHLSGALTSQELAPLAGSGASVGSLHAVRAFSGAPQETWRGALVTIEGDPEAVAQGESIVEALGGRARRLSAAGKPLYHAAATLAAGGSLALVSLATRAWASLGIPESDARPALADLSARAVAAATERDFEQAFTGPVARRDVGTIRAHRSALADRAEVLAVYVALARETLRRTQGRGKEEDILAVLEDPDR